MYWQAMRTPALPGENDVTDGSVDYYDTDWETWITAHWRKKCRNAV